MSGLPQGCVQLQQNAVVVHRSGAGGNIHTLKVAPILYASENVWCRFYRGQTSEEFFVLFSRILFNIKWKHGQECIK